MFTTRNSNGKEAKATTNCFSKIFSFGQQKKAKDSELSVYAFFVINWNIIGVLVELLLKQHPFPERFANELSVNSRKQCFFQINNILGFILLLICQNPS